MAAVEYLLLLYDNDMPEDLMYGGELSTQQKVHAKELHKILKQQSKTGGISLRDIEELITEIGYQCPWYPEKGSLDLGDWIKIGVHLHSEPRALIQHLLLWQKCKKAVETLGFHSLKAPASLLPQEASAPPPYVQLTLPAPTSMLPETSQTPPKISSKRSSAIQAGFKEAQEKGELTAEELTEGLNAFPVQEQVDAQGQIQYEWTPLPYTVLRELRKSNSETGLRSTFTQGILEGISNAYHLIPQDWKDTMRMLLTPVQYVVWDSEYQRYAIQAENNSRGAYIPDQLYGAGAFGNLQQQATGIPAAAYPAIGRCVLHAFKKVPVTGKPSKSFSTIKQGSINWLRPYVRLPTHTLSPLFKALKNHDNPVDLITLTSDQLQVLQLINDALKRCIENIPLMLVLIPTAKQPTVVLTQELTTAGKSSMNILEWIYLSHSPGHTISSPDTMYSELILKAREQSLVLLGLDIVNIILPIPLKDWERMLHLSSSLQLALTEYVGKVSYHIPADQRILAFNRIPMSMYSVLSPTLLPEAITVFTDGGPK
ncbi:hypothetical protein E2320_014246 [Naja naja]|nr:hypothetical protein E2320_014246 [Naja naja]